MNADWAAMLASVEKRRDVDARFFKPTALLAVIDGVTDRSLSPSDIDPDRVVARFESYLAGILPARATSGWRPFWHLSRDGAWAFTRNGRTVGPDDFGKQRKPNSRRELMARIDHVFVPPAQRRFWCDPAARAELRKEVIAMLARDDADSRAVAAHLAGGPYVSAGRVEEMVGDRVMDWSDAMLSDARVGNTGQGFVGSSVARKAIERRAMELVSDRFAAFGWTVHDVSMRESYDLRCERDGAVRYVEIKGSAGRGDMVLVTRAEVAFARSHRDHMTLAVVHDIIVTVGEDGAYAAAGGVVREITPWAPDDAMLTPVSFVCLLSPI